MPITEFLERNAREFPNDICLVEINPEIKENRRVTWKEYELIEPTPQTSYRREITWSVFDEKANRFANLLIQRGIKKGDKVAILMMNCLEWLPIYFGVLKTGALAVPLNFRYSSDEIEYCVNLAEADVLVFGDAFIGRVEEIADRISKGRLLIYVGEGCPSFADDYTSLSANCSSQSPNIALTDDDNAAIYFSSGTTGFPKAILHKHRSLVHSCKCEQNHHGQQKDDVFLCIPPLYHTGAKMHWFGSLLSGGKAVILKGTKPEFILEAASKEKCTIVWLLVPWAQDILEAIESGRVNLADYELDQWRLMHIGAQPVPQSLIKKWKSIFPHHQYDTNYGLSESIGPGCVHLGMENIHKVGWERLPVQTKIEFFKRQFILFGIRKNDIRFFLLIVSILYSGFIQRLAMRDYNAGIPLVIDLYAKCHRIHCGTRLYFGKLKPLNKPENVVCRNVFGIYFDPLDIINCIKQSNNGD